MIVILNPNITYDYNTLIETKNKSKQQQKPQFFSHNACLCIAVYGVYVEGVYIFQVAYMDFVLVFNLNLTFKFIAH